MHERIVAVILVIAIGGGYVAYDTFFSSQVVDSETLENGAELVTVKSEYSGMDTVTRIRYSQDGTQFSSFFVPYLRVSLEWLKENSPQDAVIAAWWDYGHSIRGYADRAVIAYTPSKWAEEHTTAPPAWDEDRQGGFTEETRMQDLAEVFVAPPNRSIQLLSKYGVDYVLLTRSDIGKYTAISKTANKDTLRYNGLQQLPCQRDGDQCLVSKQGGKQYMVFPQSTGRFLVPIIKERGIPYMNGTVQYQLEGEPINVHQCSQLPDSNLSTNLSGCVSLNPFDKQELIYVPKEETNSTFVQLLFAPNRLARFALTYSDSSVRIWEVI